MRVLLSSVAVAALLGGVSVALAADASGTIKSLNAGKSTVTLENGATYKAPKSMKLSNFKIGEKVSVNYTKSGGKMDITSMKPAG